MSHLFALYRCCCAAVRTVQKVVDRQWLTPVQVMTYGVWLLCLHDRYHPVYPATQHRQIWHHDWTTVHFFNSIFTTSCLRLWQGGRPLTLPLVRLPAWITEKSRAWFPSHPRLETIKSFPETSIWYRRQFKIPHHHFNVKGLPVFFVLKSEIRLLWRVAPKTVCQCLWP